MEEEVASGNDNIVTEYHTYEEFLDSQINDVDLFYLEVCNHAVSHLQNAIFCFLYWFSYPDIVIVLQKLEQVLSWGEVEHSISA